MEKLWLDDDRVAERLTTPRRTITQAEVVAFAALTGEWAPLHTDVAYAARGEECCVAVAELPCGRQA